MEPYPELSDSFLTEFSEVGLPLYGVLRGSLGLGMKRDDGRERNIGNKSW
jgi:hypothetical protein